MDWKSMGGTTGLEPATSTHEFEDLRSEHHCRMRLCGILAFLFDIRED
jgi:hypothetical protein